MRNQDNHAVNPIFSIRQFYGCMAAKSSKKLGEDEVPRSVPMPPMSQSQAPSPIFPTLGVVVGEAH